MKLWKRNAIVVAIVAFVGAAVYLNWTYGQGQEAVGAADPSPSGRVLGEAALVSGKADASQKDGEKSEDAQPSASPESGEDAAKTDAGAQKPEGTGYFSSARLNRQQARDSALTILQDTLSNENAETAAKEEAGAAIETLASTTISEAQIENLVIAKGYADCVAFISDGGVSVVVSATEEGLQDADVARITEIVTGETGVTASQIMIIEAQG